MNRTTLAKLKELTLLLDLAYIHHFLGQGERYRPSEGTIQLAFGNFWYRRENPTEPPQSPQIESVVIYSSVFSAARVNYFDSLEEAIEVVQSWYDQARQ